MTESYSNTSVLFKYYTSGAEIPTNFNLLEEYYHTPSDYEREIENWITKMPAGATFNSVVFYIIFILILLTKIIAYEM